VTLVVKSTCLCLFGFGVSYHGKKNVGQKTMFGLQTTYKQLLSLFRDGLVGRDEKINILKEPLAFFPPFKIECKLLQYVLSAELL